MAKKASKMGAKKASKKVISKADRKVARKSAANRRAKKKDDCFITTACVDYYNLPDNCSQLTTLRSFRDTVLYQTKEGRSLVRNYYGIAPKLVSFLKREDDARLYRKIFRNINLACRAIENQEYSLATDIYTQVVSSIAEYFKLEITHGSKR